MLRVCEYSKDTYLERLPPDIQYELTRYVYLYEATVDRYKDQGYLRLGPGTTGGFLMSNLLRYLPIISLSLSNAFETRNTNDCITVLWMNSGHPYPTVVYYTILTVS